MPDAPLPATSRAIACARCGRPMTCTPGGACWCNAVALTDAVREQLRASYTDCLCPQCLHDAGAPPDSREKAAHPGD